MIDPISKEVATEAAKSAAGFFEKIAGSDILWASGIGSPLKLRALRNQIEGVEELRKLCEEKNFPIRLINLKALFPYIEGIALEEDKDIRKMWTNLMKNYIDPERHLESTVYPAILKQLDSKDVNILSELAAIYIASPNKVWAPQWREESANLIRLGLMREQLKVSGQTMSGSSTFTEIPTSVYLFTPFGLEFLKAIDILPSEAMRM